MIMSYYDHFLNLCTEWCYVQQASKFLVLDKEVKRKNGAATFYAILRFVAILKIPVI